MNAEAYIIITCICTFFVIVFLIAYNMATEKTVTTGELMTTKEGREQLQALREMEVRNLVQRSMAPKPCPTCKGFGKLGARAENDEKGRLIHTTSNEICKDCGGSGIEGGLPNFEFVHCEKCRGTGLIEENVGCRECNSTGMKARRKSATS